jgi:hypothetical protein
MQAWRARLERLDNQAHARGMTRGTLQLCQAARHDPLALKAS